MGSTRPHNHHVDNGHTRNEIVARHAHTEFATLDALREENKQLRELVIQLSRLVIRNVVERN